MTHESFSAAGSEPGIEIWTIEQFEPVAVETKKYGKFYNGDSYIVLKTTGEANSALYHDAHFWLGSKASQDKLGSAAIWTVTLDDMLGGRAVHHREVQGHESSLFLGYFKPAIRYLEGGNESGFNEVETNAGAEKRLLKLSGCDNMRIEEVPAEASSLSKDHCFILEVEHDIFVLMLEGAKATQRRKIISVANTLRDEEHNGRATIEIIDEFSSEEDFNIFFEALGSGSKDDLVSDDCTESYTREDPHAVYLYRVLLEEQLDLVSISKPYKQRQLSSGEVYILDTPCSGVYVWLGTAVEADVKKTYNTLAGQYLEAKGYPAWVNITRVTEGAESCTFKQYFHEWDTSSGLSTRALISDIDAGYFSSDVDESFEAAKLIGKSANARGFVPDHGNGNLEVTRFSGGERDDITESIVCGTPVLYQSEAYVVKYQYTDDTGEEAYVLYSWMGPEASSSDQLAAADLVAALEDELANVTVVKIPQGKETLHFLNIFKGNLAIVFGNKDNEYKPENANGSYDDDNIRLFRVEGTELGVDMRAVQVPEKSELLEDDDVFVLETSTAVYIWNGKESNAKEQEAAVNFVKLVVGDEKEVVSVEQGDEPDEFWEPLGAPPESGAGSAWPLAVSRRVVPPATLAAAAGYSSGRIHFEDLDVQFTQQDLSDDGVYILDAGEELYLWQGNYIPERVKAARSNILKAYLEDDGLDRTMQSAVVVFVKQGQEPAVFRKLFPNWDAHMWDNQSSYEDLKSETKAANS